MKMSKTQRIRTEEKLHSTIDNLKIEIEARDKNITILKNKLRKLKAKLETAKTGIEMHTASKETE